MGESVKWDKDNQMKLLVLIARGRSQISEAEWHEIASHFNGASWNAVRLQYTSIKKEWEPILSAEDAGENPPLPPTSAAPKRKPKTPAAKDSDDKKAKKTKKGKTA